MLAYVTLGCWAAFELFLRVVEAVQGRGGRAHDRGTRVVVALSLGAAVGLAAAAASPGHAHVRVAGALVMWAGLALRVWAVAALGRAFRTTVEVDPGQAVVSRGPYGRIRHPAYAGLLLIVAGFGLAMADWRALAVCLVLPPPAIVRRIQVEEAELERVLGDPYRAYAARSDRLLPGLW